MGREAAIWFLAGCVWVVLEAGVQRTTAWIQRQQLPPLDALVGLVGEIVLWPLSVALVAVVGLWSVGRLLGRGMRGDRGEEDR